RRRGIVDGMREGIVEVEGQPLAIRAAQTHSNPVIVGRTGVHPSWIGTALPREECITTGNHRTFSLGSVELAWNAVQEVEDVQIASAEFMVNAVIVIGRRAARKIEVG